MLSNIIVMSETPEITTSASEKDELVSRTPHLRSHPFNHSLSVSDVCVTEWVVKNNTQSMAFLLGDDSCKGDSVNQIQLFLCAKGFLLKWNRLTLNMFDSLGKTIVA